MEEINAENWELLAKPDAAYRAEERAPFTRSHFVRLIEGVKTEFVLASYSNCLFFTITQIGKLGTIMRAQCDVTLEGERSFSVETLLGARNRDEM